MSILKRIKKHPQVTRVRRYLVYITAVGFCQLVRHLPWNRTISWGRCLGRFAFHRVRYGRKLTLDNLNRVFGYEMTDREIMQIAEKVYENMGITALEFPKMSLISDREFFRTVDYDEGDIRYIRSLLEKKKGVIFASAHMGNWEMLAGFGGRLGFAMSILYKPSTNPYLNRIWFGLRKRNRLIDITRDLSLVTKRLRENEVVCILFDENARSRGIKLPFLGHPASTYKGPAFFALRTGCPIVCAYFIRQASGKHRLIIERIIEPARTGNLEEDIITVMTEMNRSLEKMIRRYPDQWNWIYKRWS
jgi:KDO2-lipid IV(A) lauroyltransferase